MTKNIKEFYKFEYKCSMNGCGKLYGSDTEEKGQHLCPMHDLRFRNRHKQIFKMFHNFE